MQSAQLANTNMDAVCAVTKLHETNLHLIRSLKRSSSLSLTCQHGENQHKLESVPAFVSFPFAIQRADDCFLLPKGLLDRGNWCKEIRWLARGDEGAWRFRSDPLLQHGGALTLTVTARTQPEWPTGFEKGIHATCLHLPVPILTRLKEWYLVPLLTAVTAANDLAMSAKAAAPRARAW